MIQPLRATISHSLLTRLNQIAYERVIDLNAINQVEFRARNLTKANHAAYLVVMGVCACLKGNKEEMHSFFAQAIQERPTMSVLDNYAICMQFTGEVDLLIQHCRNIFKGHAANLGLMKRIQVWFEDYGCISDAAEVEVVLRKMGQRPNMINYEGVIKSLADRGLVESDLTAVLHAAKAFLREKGFARVVNSRHMRVSDNEPVYTQRLSIRADLDELFELELELMQHLMSLSLPAYEKNAVCVFLGGEHVEESTNDAVAN